MRDKASKTETEKQIEAHREGDKRVRKGTGDPETHRDEEGRGKGEGENKKEAKVKVASGMGSEGARSQSLVCGVPRGTRKQKDRWRA